MNVKLLRKVKKHILAEPKRFIMSLTYSYRSQDRPKIMGRPFAKCGTAACVAGWVCILEKVSKPFVSMDKAQELLGLTLKEADRLFEPGLWPGKYQGGTTDDGEEKTAKIAAARIEHFIKTKGRE